MYGYELYDEIKKIDGKLRVCFMTATYLNYEALRAAFPTIEIECYIQKPVETKDLIKRVNAEPFRFMDRSSQTECACLTYHSTPI
jgi:response regulator RpfG family c-di-GMP phosphodiesterase